MIDLNHSLHGRERGDFLWSCWVLLGRVDECIYGIFIFGFFSLLFLSISFSKGGDDSPFKCVASIHGAKLTEELAESLTVPCLLLPAGDDPSIEPLEKVLAGKEFGDRCQFNTYTSQKTHYPLYFVVINEYFMFDRSISWVLCSSGGLGER